MTQKIDLPALLDTNDIVAVDTCAILSDGFIKLFKESAKAVFKLNKPLILHGSVVNELVRISRTAEHPKCNIAQEALLILKVFEHYKIFKYWGNPKDFRLADQQFLEYVIELMTDNNIAIITLDKKLTSDILMQNMINSYHGHIIKVFGLSDYGKLFDCSNLQNNEGISKKSNNSLIYTKSVESYKKLFNL